MQTTSAVRAAHPVDVRKATATGAHLVAQNNDFQDDEPRVRPERTCLECGYRGMHAAGCPAEPFDEEFGE